MKAENYCMGCMEKREQGPVCPYCGYQHDTLPESPLYLTPGTILNGKYLIGRVLGHGGFGITYLALDLTLQVRLAIKEFLPRDLATRSSNTTTVTPYTGATKEHFDYGLEKFLEEARALARFEDSPCIVSVKDFFRANGTAYFVMNFVEGITFKEYLKNHGEKIDYDKALRILMPVMDALREVHQTGLLHRDISPDNIYITNDGRIKLLDFGAARNATGEHSKSLSVMLKAGYAPEEQYRSKGKQGPWTDIYAVGATLYRAITGKVPVEALDRMNEDTLEPPTRLGIKIPPHAENALLKALSVKASDRFQEMKMFQQALTMNSDEDIVKMPAVSTPLTTSPSVPTAAIPETTVTQKAPKPETAASDTPAVAKLEKESPKKAPESATATQTTPTVPKSKTTSQKKAPTTTNKQKSKQLPSFQAASSQNSYFEIIWNLYNIRHEGLLVIEKEGNKGIFRVLCIDKNTEQVYDCVDQSVTGRKVRDGIVLNCSNPISHGGYSYSPNNIKLFYNGDIYIEDDAGYWSTYVDAYEITNEYQFERMVRKYGLK